MKKKKDWCVILDGTWGNAIIRTYFVEKQVK